MSPAPLRSAGEAVLSGCRSLCAGAEAVGDRLVIPQTLFVRQRSKASASQASTQVRRRSWPIWPASHVYRAMIDSMSLIPGVHSMQYSRLFTIEERLARLIQLLQEGGRSSPQLAEALDVSVPTVARDVKALREQGHRIEATRVGRGWQYSLLNNARTPISQRNTRRSMSESSRSEAETTR